MNKKNIEINDDLISVTIAHILGDIDDLPEIAKSIIKRGYRNFCSIYQEVVGLKVGKKHTITLPDFPLNPEVIEYMQHFFSEYQDLYRQFITLNRSAKALMNIDRHASPAKFEERLNLLVTGKDDLCGRRILQELMAW